MLSLEEKVYRKIEAGERHNAFLQMIPHWDAKLGGGKGQELQSVTILCEGTSSEQMTWEVLDVDTKEIPPRPGYYVIHLGKRFA